MEKYNLTVLLILLIGILALVSCSSGGDNSSPIGGGGYTGVYGSIEHCGKKYKTVVIGTQTWFAENVNCPTDEGSRCYEDDPINCSKYGRLYNWATAMSVCPTGWHLPDYTELERLINYAGGKEIAGVKLKATSGWNNSGNGTNELGFSALPGGRFDPNDEYCFGDVGERGKWWGSTGDLKGDYFNMTILFNKSKANLGDDDMGKKSNKLFMYSVRCIKN